MFLKNALPGMYVARVSLPARAVRCLRLLVQAVCLTLLLAALSGCSDEEDPPPQAKPETAESATPKDFAGVPVDKWNAYVDLYNDSDLVLGQVQAYFKTLGAAEAPNEDPDLSASATSWLSPASAEQGRARSLIQAALAKSAPGASGAPGEPAEPVESAGPAMLDRQARVYAMSLDRFRLLLQEARDYYNSRAFVDDGFARGRSIHTRMLEASLLFDAADREFSQVMRREDRNRQIANASEMRGQGLAAQDVGDEFLRQGIAAENIYELDLESFRPLYEILSKSLERLESAAADLERLSDEGVQSEVAVKLAGIGRELKVKAGDIMLRVSRGAPNGDTAPSPDERARDRKSTPEEFYRIMGRYTRQYNQVVS